MQTNGNEDLSELDNWDPRKEAYSRPDFNCYTKGIGKDYSRRERDGEEVKLFVKGIPNDLTEEGLKNLFLEFGEVLNVKKCASKFPEQGMTFGFITYRSIKEALPAIEKFNGFQITQKFRLNVKIAKSEEERNRERKKREEEQAYLNSLTGKAPRGSSSSDDSTKENRPGQTVSSTESEKVAPEEPRTSTPVAKTAPTTPVDTGGMERLGPRSGDKGVGLMNRCRTPELPERGMGRGLLSISPCKPGGEGGGTLRVADDHLSTTMQPLVQVRDDLKITVLGNAQGSRQVETSPDQLVDVPESAGNVPLGGASPRAPYPYPHRAPAPHWSENGSPYYPRPRPPYSGYRPQFRSQFRPPRHHFHGYGTPRHGFQGYMPRQPRPRWGPPRYPRHFHGDYNGMPGPRFPAKEARSPRGFHGADESMALMSDTGSVSSEKPVKRLFPCTNCGKPGSSKCRNCKTPYCCRQCQQNDWKRHKDLCKQISETNREEEAVAKRFDVSVDEELVNACQGALAESVKKSAAARESSVPKVTYRKLALNKPDKSVVTWVDNPCSVWVQPMDANMLKLFMELNIQMKERYTDGGKTVGDKVQTGEYYAALVKGYNTWSRARIVSVQGSKDISVIYIDYGNTDVVSSDCLKQIDPSLLQLPAQAIHCSLAGFMDNPSVGWAPEHVALTKKLLPEGQTVIVEPIDYRDGLYIIKVKAENGEASYSDVLKQAGCPLTPILPKPKSIAKADEIPLASDKLKPGDHILVNIVTVDSPDQFKAQLCEEDRIAAFTKFCQELHQCYTSTTEPYPCSVDEVVVAKFSLDGTWYRAKVLSITGDIIRVAYIDFGNEEDVSSKDIRIAGDRCKQFPAQAANCALVGILPPETGQWPEDAIQLLRGLKPIQAVVKSKLGKKLMIDVYVEDCGSLSAHLVSNGWARFDGKTKPSDLVQPSVKTSETQNSALDLQNSLPPCTSPSTPVQVVTAKTEPQTQTNLSAVRLVQGQLTSAICSSVEEDGSFYIQITAEEIIANLLLVVEKLNQVYNDRPLVTLKPDKGQLVCANYEGSWCRAIVKDILADGQVKLFFVDYGNTSCLPMDHIQSLDEQFSKIPAQAVRCSLEGTDSVKWSPEMTIKLNGLILEKPVSLTSVSEVGSVSYVQVVCDGSDVNSAVLGNKQPLSTVNTSNTPAQPIQAVTTQTATPSVKPMPVVKLVRGKLTPANCPFVEEDGSFYMQITAEENIANLVLLLEKLGQVYNDRPLVTLKPVKGQLVCANYEGSWCRASIEDILGNGQVRLFFVDYGNTSCLPMDHIQSLDEQFSKVPAQAVRCSLEGTDSVKWSPEMTIKLNGLILNKPVTLTLVSEVGSVSYVQVVCDESDVNSAVLGNKQPLSTMNTSNTPAQPIQAVTTQTATPSVKPMPVVKLVRGKLTPANCSFVEEDGSFYMQITAEENIANLVLLLEKLGQVYNDRPLVTLKPVKGQLVCANYEGSWCRASIEDILGNGQVRLFFVDYGNTSCLPMDHIQSLDEQFSKVPAQAVRCSLEGTDSVKWSPEMTIKLNGLILDKPVTLTSVSEVGSVSYVQVVCDESDVNSAVLGNKQPLSTVNTSNTPAQPIQAVTTQTATPSVKPMPVVKLVRGKLTPANCSFVEEDGSFYMQITAEENIANLVLLLEKLGQVYNDRPLVTLKPVKGQLVCANYEGSWCRASIEDILGNGQVKLFFVDYGNTSCLPMDHIQSLDEQFSKVPAQAVRCSLEGTDSVKWSPEMTIKLNGLILNKPVTLTLVSEVGSVSYVQVVCDESDVNSAVLGKRPNTASLTTTPSTSLTTAPSTSLTTTPSPAQTAHAQTVNQTSHPLPLVKLVQGRSIKAFCTIVEKDGSFYIQNVSPENMDDITEMAGMDSVYLERPVVPFRPVIGQLVCGNYDGSWCRGIVRNVQPDGQVLLHFVDYGNEGLLPSKCVQSLEENFSKMPAQAIKCVLEGSDSVTWSKRMHQTLSDFVMNKISSLTLVKCVSGTNYVSVTSNQGVDVNSAVLQQGQPAATRITLPSLGPATLQSKEADLTLMTILSPGEFYCITPQAEELTTKVHAACSKLEPDATYDPEKNEVCAAVYAHDQRFYRVAVTDKEAASGRYEVFYLDYGDVAIVQQNQLRRLGSEFTQPPCAILCYIPGVVCGADGDWSPKVIEVIQSCSQKSVHVEVVSEKKGRHEIRMFHNGVDIGQMLQQSSRPAPVPTTADPPGQSAGPALSDAEQLRKQNEDLKRRLEALEAMMLAQHNKS